MKTTATDVHDNKQTNKKLDRHFRNLQEQMCGSRGMVKHQLWTERRRSNWQVT